MNFGTYCPLSTTLKLLDAELVQWQTAHCWGLAPPFYPCRMLVGTDDTPIDVMHLPIELTFGISLLLESCHNPLPQPDFTLFCKSAQIPSASILRSLAHRATVRLSAIPTRCH